MNQRLLLIVPVLALLGAASFLILHKSSVQHETTVDDFKYCLMRNMNDCNLAKSEEEKKQCFRSQNYITSEMSSSACTEFFAFFDQAKGDEYLNAHDYFKQCYLNDAVLTTISKSKFYLDKIFTPIYKSCAGF